MGVYRRNIQIQPTTGILRRTAAKVRRSWQHGALLLLCLCLLVHTSESFSVQPTTLRQRLGSIWESTASTTPRSCHLSATKTKQTEVGYNVAAIVANRRTEALVTTMISKNEDEDDTEETERVSNERDLSDDSHDTNSRAKDDGDDEKLKRRTAAGTAALLRRKGAASSRSRKALKNTSVGARRVASATRARTSPGAPSKIMDTVRTVAAAAGSTSAPENTNTTAQTSEAKGNSTSRFQVGNNVIRSTISSMLENQDTTKTSKTLDDNDLSMNAYRYHGPIGLISEPPDPLSHDFLHKPKPGTVLLQPSVEHSTRPGPETLSVRVATPQDDLHIASLRLSVFSDFSSELRKQFCARSCQVLADRRARGATCLVATHKGRAANEVIFGSVECSVHEFYATKLGQRRPKYSMLYVTEVAVCPSARRCGIGTKLLQGADELALLRNVESLYLHVDVLNFGAMELYRKAGYQKVVSVDPMYAEFTTTLNLHDGATKGRRHHLLSKHLTRNPTWLPLPEERSRPHCLSRIDTATWGYEMAQ